MTIWYLMDAYNISEQEVAAMLQMKQEKEEQDADILQTGVNLVYVSRHWGARNTDTGHANHE